MPAKRPAGRPPKYGKHALAGGLRVRLTEHHQAAMEQLSANATPPRTVSETVRQAIADYIMRHYHDSKSAGKEAGNKTATMAGNHAGDTP